MIDKKWEVVESFYRHIESLIKNGNTVCYKRHDIKKIYFKKHPSFEYIEIFLKKTGILFNDYFHEELEYEIFIDKEYTFSKFLKVKNHFSVIEEKKIKGVY
jgi:hypothetical protein